MLTHKEMNSEDRNQNELDINIDSLWIIGPRAKGGKHSNVYHGNFAPQIPNQMIRRYTKEGDTILEMFMGSGTTLFECEALSRNYIGFDINEEIISFVENKMIDSRNITFFIHNSSISDGEQVNFYVSEDLNKLNKSHVDHIIIHPPYFDIIKFTSKEEDLSNSASVNQFINKFVQSLENCYKYLSPNKHFSLVIGDIYKNGEVIPLGFYLMYAIRKNFNCKLKGIVVKDMVGNRGKIGAEALWRYRTLKSDTFLFKHEYIFVFKKNK